MSTFSSALTALLTVSLTMSFVITLLILMNNLLANKITAAFRYYMWLIVLAGLLIPFRPSVPVPFEPLRIPASLETLETAVTPAAAQAAEQNSIAPASGMPRTSRPFVLLGIWITGALTVSAFHLSSYGKFAAAVRRWGTETEDRRIRSIMRAVRCDMGLENKDFEIKTCVLVSSPMLIGFFRPVILLPETPISSDELHYIFRHELTHYRRGDLWINLLVVLASALHWFNPFVYLMARTIRAECEAACDETVVADKSADRRRQYGETIIGFAGARNTRNTALTTYFYGGSSIMKKRLVSIMDTSRKNKWLALACAMGVVMATILSGSAVAATSGADQYIGEARAKSIALQHAGISEQQTVFINVHMDRDDGRFVYDVEFYSGETEYDYEIDAVGGEILEFDRDIEHYSAQNRRSSQSGNSNQTGNYIGEARAKSIALSDAGIAEESQVSRMRVRLDREDRRMVYEVDFRRDRTEYEYEIDAVSGSILNADMETNRR